MNQEELITKITQEVIKRFNEITHTKEAPVIKGKGTVSEYESGIIINSPMDLAPYIDHTLLKPDAKQSQIDQLCQEAIQYHFCSVCIQPYWVGYCAKKLRGTGVKVCTVVGFPLGANDPKSKAYETRQAIEDGAHEIDMVINIGAMKSGNIKMVEDDLRAIKRACRQTTITKAIIETFLLTDDEKVIACQLAKKIGYNFVKTSTGFAGGGATVHDVALMRRTVGPKMGIKAAGGIHNFEEAKAMIAAGATRLGTSSGVKIVNG
ncbi:Deoxyribose-phosphate aldolase [Atribacter laminatus]|jgi:deoxyribose-phosphate aldolase|uniref:Deoxyribose-phosphate aldolase n=2 Tax=Atribacter laminatus TaxID=2847778 RepID=A0A7T1AK65_ATRLM|nr:deoxyribose-phosphate aldolase [Atribacter laminatus]QPM67413.1 Deoxyribose-phosphate aldolase [Atribacter laminatus]